MVSHHLVGIALQQLLSGAVSMARFSSAVDGGGKVANVVVTQATNFLRTRFIDHSLPLTAAVQTATDRAWQALELVLAGDSFWDRVKGVLATGDAKGFRNDVRALLAAAGVDGAYPVDHKAAARELRAAREAGVLQPTGLTPAGMADSVGVFGRFDDPAELAARQWRAAEVMAAELKGHGYPALAAVAGFRPTPNSPPLLGVAVRYFFRKAVEADAELARGLAFARMENMAEAQEHHFELLDRVIVQQGEKLDAALGELAAEVAEVKAVALDIRAEQDRLGDQNRQIMECVLALQAKLDQVGRSAVRPQDSLSVRTDGERELVKKVVAQYRQLSPAERGARPALQNAVGLLEVAAGEFAAAQSDFAAVAEAVADPVAKGAAHINGYRAALEARDWGGALREMMAATRCDARRFAPFPVGKYRPERILGAGGFGVAFLCTHKYMDTRVVVKALSGSGPGRDFDAVFTEARAAAAVQHPGIVRVTDCGYAEPGTKGRPFVVMDYFPGRALDEYVRTEGPVPVGHLIPLARALADALGAAHAKGILHRDVKPGNILVAWDGNSFEGRVIDFGLAIQYRAARAASTPRASKTLAGESMAGTIEYAAPEQMGRGSGAPVGLYSDVYGWAKTCCFALFQTAQPTLRHWQGIPAGVADLLGRCLEEDPSGRPRSFGDVIAGLDCLGSAGKAVFTARLVPVRHRGQGGRSDDEDGDDDAPTRGRRNRNESPGRGRPRKKHQHGAFPVWAGVFIAAGALFFVVVLAVVVARRPTDSDKGVAGTPGAGSGPTQGGGAGKQEGAVGAPGGRAKGPVSPVPAPSEPTVVPVGKEPIILGSIEHDPKFKTVGPEGAALIGLEARFAKFGSTDIVRAVRPIYRVNGKEEFGKQFGTNLTGSVTLKARDGYAVGGIIGKAGWWCNGFSLTFMKVRPDGTLDPKDSYESEWAGFNGQGDVIRVTGDGSRVVGIVGKIVGTETTALGLLYKGQEEFDPDSGTR